MLSVLFNTVIAVSFAMIAYTVYTGLARTGQLRTNMLGIATAAMFGSCAVSHESHAFHMLMPFFGVEV
ncbi:MAG: hybrid sensor histidine kinase/response regulator, partial [Candidatus Eremiobacteraeota bacterium]|nr:hybrid sensor histidine kinase/response regulator [Candidatus Eremiobacteraeota bacterium]